METEVKVEPLTDEMSKSILDCCSSLPMLPMSHNKIYPSGMILPIAYGKYVKTILDMEVKKDDTWVISFPRSGTTWTQEMVWLLKNNMEFKKARENYIYDRFRFLEFDAIFDLSSHFSEDIKQIKSPRFFKSHLHKLLLPKQLWTEKPKIVFIFRNPKDSAISWFHHYRLWNNYTGPLEQFLTAFLNDKLMFTPFWDMVLEFWKMRNEPNVLFITYEDMKKDLEGVVIKVAKFLGVQYSKEETAALLEHLSFSSMKNNESVNLEKLLKGFGAKENDIGFIRQGESGGWRQLFTPEISRMFDEWTSRNLEGTDFPRDYV